MASRSIGTEMGLCLVIAIAAVVLTVWQVAIDRSVFESFFGAVNPVAMMIGAGVAGFMAIAYLQRASNLAMLGPGGGRDAL